MERLARSRKWLITINNPIDHGFDHVRIRAAVVDLPGLVYWCMCDEEGDECATLHTHVFFVCENPLTHTQVDARFPTFHREIARGKSVENRAYGLKDGAKFNKRPDGSYSYKEPAVTCMRESIFPIPLRKAAKCPLSIRVKARTLISS